MTVVLGRLVAEARGRTRCQRVATPLIAAMLFAFTGCGDPVGAGAIAGQYRLVTVAGRALPYVPPPSTGFFSPAIVHGELVLRGDRTFGLGSSSQGFVSGTFRTTGDEVRLTIPPREGSFGPAQITGVAGGDSIVLNIGPDGAALPYVFRRVSRDSVTVSRGAYALAAVNGRGEPLTTLDTVIGETRYVTIVLFDTLDFTDAVFYRRHRSEQSTATTAQGPVSASGSEQSYVGAYGGGAGRVILRPYWVFDNQPMNDTLSIVGTALVRRTALRTGTLEERYERR